MEQTSVQKVARVLKGCVLVTFVINLLVLPLVPGTVGLLMDGGPEEVILALRGIFHVGTGTGEGLIHPAAYFLSAMIAVWQDMLSAVWTFFFLLCGICTAVILWQAKRVLDTVLEGNPFQMSNAGNLKRAAVCCWLISLAALLRLIHWIVMAGNLGPLFTYNTLFVPVFFMGGLLFQVMSTLFRQAAELKEDQDLTI